MISIDFLVVAKDVDDDGIYDTPRCLNWLPLVMDLLVWGASADFVGFFDHLLGVKTRTASTVGTATIALSITTAKEITARTLDGTLMTASRTWVLPVSGLEPTATLSLSTVNPVSTTMNGQIDQGIATPIAKSPNSTQGTAQDTGYKQNGNPSKLTTKPKPSSGYVHAARAASRIRLSTFSILLELQYS